MDKQFPLTFYKGYNHFSMQGLKLNNVSKIGRWSNLGYVTLCLLSDTTQMPRLMSGQCQYTKVRWSRNSGYLQLDWNWTVSRLIIFKLYSRKLCKDWCNHVPKLKKYIFRAHAYISRPIFDFNTKMCDSLRPSDAIWRHRYGSTLAQVMACCLTAPEPMLTYHQ